MQSTYLKCLVCVKEHTDNESDGERYKEDIFILLSYLFFMVWTIFARIHKRMRNVVYQDKSITLSVIHKLIESLNEDYVNRNIEEKK